MSVRDTPATCKASGWGVPPTDVNLGTQTSSGKGRSPATWTPLGAGVETPPASVAVSDQDGCCGEHRASGLRHRHGLWHSRCVATYHQVSTSRLDLRAVTLDDVDGVHDLHADPRVWGHFPSGRHADRAASARLVERIVDDWATTGLGYWAVHLRADLAGGPRAGELVGVAGVRCVSGTRWNLYYRLAPADHGLGLAGEAVSAALAAAADVDPSPGCPRKPQRYSGGRPLVRLGRPSGVDAKRGGSATGMTETAGDSSQVDASAQELGCVVVSEIVKGRFDVKAGD